MHLRFWAVSKKFDPRTLSISEIIHSKKHGSLNAEQFAFQNTLQQSTC